MDFRLNVFISVARHLSFTKAAKELYISQPATSKHIQELESAYKVQLFERSGNKIRLTQAGEIFMKHAEAIHEGYQALQLDMNLLSNNFNGSLRIGASTTIAQYVLPPMIAQHISLFPDIRLSMFSGNSEQIEQAIYEHKIDIGMVEGSSRKHDLKYPFFAKDELVLVTHTQNKIKDEITPEELRSLPLVLREAGSGTLEVIEKALLSNRLKLSQMNILLQMGSTEGIKSFLQNCPSAYAIISISAVLKELAENKLKVIEISNMKLERDFSFVFPAGYHSDTVEHFIRFLHNCYNKKL